MANGYTYVSVPNNQTLSLNSTTNTLNITGSNGIVITTDSVTNSVNINLASTSPIPNLSVTNSLTINPSTTGALNNVVIGGVTPRSATFSSLTATGATSLSPANATVTISPTGTGTLVVNPATTGTINNVNIGSVAPSTGRFTTVTLTSTPGTTPTSAVTRGQLNALIAAYGVALN